MKSKIVDYICEPNNYRIQIIDSTYGVVTIALLIDEKPTLYRKYRTKDINYEVGNRLVEIFCNQLGTKKVKLYNENDDDMHVDLARESLKKVYNRLGLLIWERG